MFTPENFSSEDKSKKAAAKYPVLKIISMIFGILAGAAILLYAYRYTKQYLEQIAQYKQMGMDIPQTTLNVIYLQLGLTFLCGIMPIVGALLTNRCAKTSILLTAAPICWGLVNAIPSVIISIIQKVPVKEMTDVIIMAAGGILALVSSILLAAAPAYCKKDEADEIFEEFEIDGAADEDSDPQDALQDLAEDAAEKVEDVKEAVSDKVEDVKEAVSDKVEDVKEAVSDKVEDVKEAVSDKVEDVKEVVSETVEDVKEAVSDKVEEVKDAAEEMLDDKE